MVNVKIEIIYNKLYKKTLTVQYLSVDTDILRRVSNFRPSRPEIIVM